MGADDDQYARGFVLLLVLDEDGVLSVLDEVSLLDEFSVLGEDELVDVGWALDDLLNTVAVLDDTVESLDVVDVLDAMGVLDGTVVVLVDVADVAVAGEVLGPVVLVAVLPVVGLSPSGWTVVPQPRAATNPMPTASLRMKRPPEATRQA
jgi:hypothetical protein